MSKKSRKNLNIALSGATGRMGLAIQEIAAEYDITLTAKITQAADWKKLKPSDIDVVVDFSTPAGMTQALGWCLAQKKPLLSGTTGLSATQKAKYKQAGAKIPLLYSANMSQGIAVMTQMLRSLTPIKDWDFHIEEIHHGKKKDSPSGTALSLQEQLKKVVGRDLPPPHAIRGGGTPGIHQIWAMGPDEVVILQHTAFNRRVFAQGAIKGARWLFDKKEPGLYDLSDLCP